ncbi:HYR-like domain-containing protein [Flavobacterium johnsoniae]|uniref:Gliding motility-associated C-terminal domain-containing protein n=1 Tax=Flavobacterium johnsoniae TaxID=986 RepID=A0A1M5IAB2_FLAJO|nr:gliding motility-associated C-terminal domain-containing protein [Flavobacterium johnsoniae]SHG25202.1 gliding motility-associated C-terminal domain-containing protein [Flavobacterium johnsoniae]
MEKQLLFLNNFLRDIKKIQFVVLFLLTSSIGLAQTITTNKTVTANTGNCGIIDVKVDITGANPITRNSDVVLAIDISGSMGNTISGDFKTSMDYAKDAALAFLNQAKANPQNRIAIVAYSTTASLKIGLTYLNAAGVTQITNQINALQATNSTNIYAGIVRSETELETNGRFDCSTARAIILLTDGVTNVTGTSGNTNCNVSKTSQCVTDAINAATNAKTTTKSSVVYNNQVFSVGLFGGISGNINTNNSDQNIAKYTLDNIQGSAAYITQSGANLTAIYNQIATQISWIAQSLIAKETIIPGFTIGGITTTKGTASLSGQVITWNTDFLNSETISLTYQLTPTGSACGNQTVSTSTLNYQNSSCANDSKAITSPSYFVPCVPIITGVLTACGSTTLTASTNASSPTYVWYKDNAVLAGQTSSTLTATTSGVYKVKVKNGVTNCELTSADSTVSISPAAALIAPANANISGCSTAAITGLPYSTASSNITLAQLNTAGGSLSNSSSIGSYTISYSDTASGTCPTIVTRTFKVTTGCGNVTALQTITIQDTTAPTWTTQANALNVTLQCSDTAGLATAQNQAPTATDNCGGTVTYTKTSGAFSAGTCANSGTYTNTWTAKDICNNTSTVFTQVITIQDTTAPTWTTQANALNVTLQCSDTAGLATAQNQAPTATDNCGGTVTYTKTNGTFSAGSCANSGTYTNTWTAKDICNNTSTVFTQVITIQDTTAPSWATQANALNVTLQCSDTAGLATAQNQAPTATDNCGGTVTYTKTSGAFSAGTCANSGTYTNTWTAKDICNNTSTVFTQIITIQDTTAPTWTTSSNALNVTLQCSDTAGLATAQNQAPTAADNCGGTVTYTKTSGVFSVGNCDNSGTYTNTWIAKDICNNTSTVFTQVITIQDTTAPTWTAQANALNVTLQCSDTAGLATAQNQAPTATDNCGGTVTYTKTSGAFSAGTCANSGTYTNTWIAKDVCNNTSTVFTQVITIQDTTEPTWTTQANALNVTLQCSDTSGLATAQNQAPTATDNCGGTVIYTKTSGAFSAGTCSNSGTYTNTWIAKDICNNTSTEFTQIITIEDTTAPNWTTASNALNVTLQCSDTAGLATAQNQAPTATDTCGGTVTYTKTSGAFTAGTCANSGTYTNTWIAKDICNNTSTVFTQIITIEDTTAPNWTTASNALNVTLQCSDTAGLATAQNQAPTATDTCGGTVTYTKTSGAFSAGTCANSGTYTNTWIAKDICNNTSTVFTQVITIQDTTAPTWTTQANALNVTLQCSDTAGLVTAQNQAPTAADNCGGTVTYTKTTGVFTAGSCANSGTYTNTWTAKDICNNTSTVFTQVITIQDTSIPTWTTQAGSLDRTIECSNQQALASAQALFPTASGACDIDLTNITKVSGQFVASQGCGNAGTYTNTWTVKDDCGNTSETFTQVITIQDTTAPTWTTQAGSLNQTIECSNSEALALAQALFPTASDLCDADVTNITKVSGQFVASQGCGNTGTYTNTWTVKDDCGNTSETFTQVITIQDTTAPTWTTQAGSLNQTIECSNSEALASAQALFPTASDLCDADVTNITKISGQFTASQGCGNAGTYTNTWTVKDDCGNTSETFTQVITIQDTTAPVFTGELPGNITVSCDAVPEPANMEAADNCNSNLPIVFTETKSDIQNECGSNYTLTRTWKTSDCSNNVVSHTQIITVRDTTAPTGTAPSNIADLQSTTQITAGNPADITDAADNCSGNVTVTVSDTNNEGSGCEGSPYILTRTYTLSDCAGNKTELVQTFTVENKVSVSGIATNTSCFGGSDGSILVTNSPGSTVIIRNDKNEVVGNANLPAGTYTLTAASPVSETQNCTASAMVVITQPEYTVKISGRIINVDTHTGIANVPVTLIPQSPTTGPILLKLTGQDGSYSFSGMPSGNYLVQVQDANLNSAYQLYPVNSSLFFTALQDCVIQKHDFEYGSSTLPVLGDYVWYDVNSNGIQDEWYDANNDGIVTKNIPDGNGAIDYSLWEWIDFNGDGSYQGPSNVGELNAGGFGNALSPNIIIDGPNGYHEEVIVGIQGFWRDRPETANPYGDYTVKLVKDANFDAVAAALGATGLVKTLPALADKKITGKIGKAQLHTICSTTSASSLIAAVTPEDLVHLDLDFGVSCKTYLDIAANDDSAGPVAGVNNVTHNVLNVLTNDTLEGVIVTPSDVIITTVTPNEFLQLNPDGSVDVLPNAPVGTLTLVYQICEADETSNCDTATVTITIEAPVMTVTAASICVNDVPYLDYVVTPVNFTPVNGVTIAWANAQNTVITTMTNLALSGRVLWPGAVVDENGKGIDWPGWVFENNKWIQAPDGFESLRPTVNLTISVNPSETITVSYPPADPFCTARPTFVILANDDTPQPITGPAGVTNIINVLNNDTLNNSPINLNDITLTTVTPDPKGVLTLNPDGSVDVAANAPGGTYTLTYQICEKADAGNCDTAVVTVTILNSPVNANDDNYANIGCNTFGLVGNVLSNDLKGQLPATLQLVNFTLLSGNNNAKTDPNITIDASGNVNVSSLTPAGTYTYMYRICDKLSAENCDTAVVTITVAPNGTSNITSEACNDDTTLLNLSNLLPEETPITGTWFDTNDTRALQGNILNTHGLALGNYQFEYKITDENCPRSILLTMEVNDDCKVLACENILVHNAFSPNGDGKNDVFVIDGIGDSTCYPENTVEIYNRWGILVFETHNYNNTTNAFDGTSRGRTTIRQSEGLPTGTYFYIVTYKSVDGNNVIQNNKKEGYLYLSK